MIDGSANKDAYYFSHDSNARNDIKLVRLRRKFGWEGYGYYWAIIESLREQGDYELEINSIPDLAFELHMEEDKLRAVIYDFELFIINEHTFHSKRLKRSMAQYNERKQKLSEAGKRGNDKRWNSKTSEDMAIATRSQGDSHPIALKKMKEKEIKEKVKEFVTLAPAEIKQLQNSYGVEAYEWMIDKLNNYKQAYSKEYASDFGAIKKWVVDEYSKSHPNNKPRFVA